MLVLVIACRKSAGAHWLDVVAELIQWSTQAWREKRIN
jgi:hypothetical protein